MLSVLVWFSGGSNSYAADYLATQRLYFQGRYQQCESVCLAEVERGIWNEKWSQLLIRCRLTTGRYEQALDIYQPAIRRFRHSIALRAQGYDIYQRLNRPQLAEAQHASIIRMVQASPWRYASASDRLVIGRLLLHQGEDARDVLELAYDRARKSNPRLADVHLATAELALDKHDYAEAAKALEPCLELQPDNPQLHLLLARAWRSSDPQRATQALAKALELNPQHVPSLLHQVDLLIDAEQYASATELLTTVMMVNHRHPLAWAYHAVLAHLQGHYAGERALRDAAMSISSSDPQVDHLIGKKLSRMYRFKAGAAYQRQALKLDPGFLPAKLQLSQDLLRLGEEPEAWQLADAVHAADGYNVVAFNTVTLRDQMQRFVDLESDRFLVRMAPREAEIYGQQVLELLEEAADYLAARYDTTLPQRVTVEIFPRQQDFAIRTFGVPGGAGYLGVCFGPVITANSPASQGARPANWRSVLWHEFCHVVTLTKTNNRMPRWLSEGISTYEEQQRDPAWGERLTPAYRQLIEDGKMTPVSQLSSAFLRPESPLHLQFAYYQSSLVVRYLIQQHGIETLQKILVDLGVGIPIDKVLARYAGSLPELDEGFAQYAFAQAAATGSQLDWSADPAVEKATSPEQLRELLSETPNHYQALIKSAALELKRERPAAALEHLDPLRQRYPDDRQLGGALDLAAKAYRQLNRDADERQTLERLAALNDRALEVYQRLAALQQAAGDWQGVRRQAERYLSVQPLLPTGYNLLVEAAAELQDDASQVRAMHALLRMNPLDPALLHFRIAQAKRNSGQLAGAKRSVLQALEHAPRYQAAQQLLLEITRPQKR